MFAHQQKRSCAPNGPRQRNSFILPDSIMRRVHANDILGQRQDSFGLLVFTHDSPQVGHGLAVVFCVCDCGERVGAAVILRDWNNVGPIIRVGVHAHCRGQRIDALFRTWSEEEFGPFDQQSYDLGIVVS